MKTFVFLCNQFIRYIETAENQTEAFNKLDSSKKAYWASHGETCVEVDSKSLGESISYNGLWAMKRQQSSAIRDYT